MENKFFPEDLKPEYQGRPATIITFQMLNGRAQQVLIAARTVTYCTAHRGGTTYELAAPTTEELASEKPATPLSKATSAK